MATLQCDILNGAVSDFKLMQSYKRKSNSMVNDDNKVVVKTWNENGCTKTVPSPNQRHHDNQKCHWTSDQPRTSVVIYKRQGQIESRVLQNGGPQSL